MPKIAPTSPLYAQFRQDFPAQAGQGIPGDLNYSDTIIPVVDMTNAAGTGTLPQNLQTAWDFSTGHNTVTNGTTTFVTNTGFWLVDLNLLLQIDGNPRSANLALSDGLTTKPIWEINSDSYTAAPAIAVSEAFVVFLRSGDTLSATSSDVGSILDVNYRQIATVNGVLVNPQGFSFN